MPVGRSLAVSARALSSAAALATKQCFDASSARPLRAQRQSAPLGLPPLSRGPCSRSRGEAHRIPLQNWPDARVPRFCFARSGLRAAAPTAAARPSSRRPLATTRPRPGSQYKAPKRQLQLPPRAAPRRRGAFQAEALTTRENSQSH
jgi:hypothetical protein